MIGSSATTHIWIKNQVYDKLQDGLQQGKEYKGNAKMGCGINGNYT
jgi:hypothetical protein